MTLKFEGQEIDVCGARAKVRGHKTGEWRSIISDFLNAEVKEVYGIKVPVISKEDLVVYKMILGRKVDREDVATLRSKQ